MRSAVPCDIRFIERLQLLLIRHHPHVLGVRHPVGEAGGCGGQGREGCEEGGLGDGQHQQQLLLAQACSQEDPRGVHPAHSDYRGKLFL